LDRNKIKWIIKQIILGLIEGIFYSIVYIYILPYLYSYVLSSVSYGFSISSLLPSYLTSEILIFIGLFMGLEVVARIMKGTIYNPLLRASSSLLGLLIVLSYFNDGILRVGPIPVQSGGDVFITLDLSLILLIYVAFIAAPGIIIPFVEYYVENK
jgi:hypothetical protein